MLIMVKAESKINYELKMLKNEATLESNKQKIREFLDDIKLEGISEIRRVNYCQRLRVVARWIPDKFLDPDKNTLKEIMLKLSDGYSEWTKVTYLTMLKKFYRYVLSESKYKEISGMIKINHHIDSKIKPDTLITKEEVKSLIENSYNVRDRALFSLLYDSGCRIGEILSMDIRDVGFDDYGAIIRVSGKTGYRQVRIVGDSIVYLRSWIDYHPFKSNPSSPLFCGLKDSHLNDRLTDYDVYAIIKRVIKRAGISRRIYPHLFRHTRATLLASKVAEGPLEAQMGWVHGSQQTRTYVHLSMRDQDNAILKAYDIDIKEDDKIKEDRPKPCPRCGELNPSDATYCKRCWLPFDIKLAIELDQNKKLIEQGIQSSDIVDPITKRILDTVDDSNKIKILLEILKSISSDKVKEERFVKALSESMSKIA